MPGAAETTGDFSSEREEALDELDEFHEEKQWAVCDCHPLLTRAPL